MSHNTPKSRRRLIWASAAVIALAAQSPAGAEAPSPAAASFGDDLATAFAEPPKSARPRVWWHWVNGNITEAGVRKDIEWMSRVGLGGMQNFDAALDTPQVVDKRLVYMSPEWKAAFRTAAAMAERAGLELAIAASPGWTTTGGPWVPAADAMKKLAWSETELEGGRRFRGLLSPPPKTTGGFQDLSVALPSGEHPAAALPEHYVDVAVLAYRLPVGVETPMPRVVTAAGKAIDPALLRDGRYADALEIGQGPEAALVFDFGTRQTIRSATMYAPGGGTFFFGPTLAPVLEASDDAKAWRKVADIPQSLVPTTIGFEPVAARYFRLVAPKAKASPEVVTVAFAPGVDMRSMGNLSPPSAPKTVKVSELNLRAEPRVNAAELKAGFGIAQDYYRLEGNALPAEPGIPLQSVVNLTRRMRPDGRLDWTPPPGRWRVLRLGYSLTGTTNHPATVEATGLEVDKYDGDAVRRYMQTYLGMYAETTGPNLMGARGLTALVTDSTEVGAANWTPRLIEQFRALRGYDPTPWLPALTGVVLGSRGESDAFLYDFRRTLSDLMSREHYGQIAAVAHEKGLRVYGEALESVRVAFGDDMAMRSHTDVPMSALWAYNRKTGPKKAYLSDMRGAASVAHVYGQNFVAAEALTAPFGPWNFAPRDLQPMIDLAFVTGVNLPVIHTSAHQPLDDKQPGVSLLGFGQYFNRHESWAEMAKPWVDYLARNAFLLQQGRHHADVAYFYGEEAPLVELYKDGPPKDAPTRYAYDFVNADALLSALKVDGEDLITPGGARYRVLFLGGSSQRMTLPVLRRLATLAEAGATVVGPAPSRSPALQDDPREFEGLVKRLWSGGGTTIVGKGRVIAGVDVEAALGERGVAPDFHYAGQPGAEVLFLHRKLPDAEIYFLSNRKSRTEPIEARFRVAGKLPEIWRADTGKAEPASYRIEGAETVVPLEMAADDSFFVVFQKPAPAMSATVKKASWAPVADISGGPWEVQFQEGRGAPASIRLPALGSLSEHSEPGVKYFSGVARYRKSFDLPKGARGGQPLMLDLGRFGDVAEVWVNGQLAGTVWREPHRLDIGSLVQAGRNQLEVRVANLWVNRLIGDVQPGASKVTYTSTPSYTPRAPLRLSGLVGPVTLQRPTGDPAR